MEDGERERSNASQISAIQEITQGLVQKLDPPPTWDEGVSIEGWSRSVQIWAESRAKPERKIQALVEKVCKLGLIYSHFCLFHIYTFAIFYCLLNILKEIIAEC